MNATETVHNDTAPVDQAIRELRTIRGYALRCAGTLDSAGRAEAVHSLRLSLTALDDCLDALEAEQPILGHVGHRGDTIADDRHDDLMMDADRSDH